MSHTPKNPPCANAEYGCDNHVAEEGDRCMDCERRESEEMARMERLYRKEKPLPKTGICARCKDNAVADPETGDSECCQAKVLDGSDLADFADSLEDR